MAVDVFGSHSPAVAEGGERELAYREAIRAFADVGVALREVVDRDELLHLAARKMCELVGVSRCSLYLRDEKTGLYRGQVGHDADHDIDPMIKRLTGGVEADGFTKEIVRTREPVVINDALRDPRAVRSTMRTWRVRSMMGVPMVLRGEVIGIFFLDSEDKAREFTSLERDLASAFAELAAAANFQGEMVRELRASHATVARQNQALRRAAAVDERFTRLVISGGSLREIAETVTEMTKKPCVICDSELRPLASASDESSGRMFGEDASPLPPEVGEAIAGLATDKTSVIGPFPRSRIHVRLLVAPVTVRDGHWANLVMAEQGGQFSNFDLLIGRRVASIIALEMSAERRATLAEWNARASLAAELIRGNRDIAHVERRANFLGVSLDTPHVLALVTWRDGEDMQLPDAEAMVEAVRRAAPEAAILATGVVEGIALILELPPDLPVSTGIAKVKADIAAACAELDPHGRMVGGLSMRCRAAEDYVRAYEQARQVASCIDVYCPPGTVQVLSADDLGPGRLLLAGADPEEARRFTEESIGPLMEEEAPAELLETLVCFFESGRSVRRSAAALAVHENTIRYRLSRIEKLTGMDIAADCDAQLSSQIALLVLRLQGRLPLVSAPAAPAGDDAEASGAELVSEAE